MPFYQTYRAPQTSSQHFRCYAYRAKDVVALLATLLLSQTAPLQGQGFGYLPLDALPPGYAITPAGNSRVLVTWIDATNSDRSVLVDEYQDGFEPGFQAREIYNSTYKLSAVKHEINAGGHHFLSVTERIGSYYFSRVLRYDPDYRELAQNKVPASAYYAPPGRMLGPDDRLFISSSNTSASGRFVDGNTLESGLNILIHKSTTIKVDSGDPYSDSKTITASGLDTAIESDGYVTALYQYDWLRLKRFDPNRRLKKSLLLDRPPFSFFTRTGMTSVAVNESRTTLMAWEWHEHTVIQNELKRFPSIPAFRTIRPDGSMTATVRLLPASTYADRHDRPTAGLRADGSGAVAWTVRTGNASTVWLQRLNSKQSAFEPPRLVDARPGYYTDQPLIKGDEEGNLFLAWRCRAIAGNGAQIGVLELSQLDEPLKSPRISCVAGKVRIDWENRPATRTSLWHSSDLNPDHAKRIQSDEGIPGPCHHEHPIASASGFYWLRSE